MPSHKNARNPASKGLDTGCSRHENTLQELQTNNPATNVHGSIMRKAIAIVILLLGSLAGLLAAYEGDWGARVIMMVVGAMFSAPVAGAIGGVG